MRKSSPINITYWAEYNRRSSDEGKKKQLLSNKSQTEELAKRFSTSEYPRAYHLQESKSAFYSSEDGVIQRPQFERLIELIKAGEVSGIICWHPDRL